MVFKKKATSPEFGFLPAILLIGSMVFFYLAYNAKKDSELLIKEGINVEGTITKKKITHSKKYSDKYYIQYRFSYKEKEYSGENRVHSDFWKELDEGEKIPIIIEYNRPGNSGIDSEYVYSGEDDYTVLAFASLIMGTLFIAIPYVLSRRQSRRK